MNDGVINVVSSTYVGSVKKILRLVGWIFASFRELNCRPKKLSSMTVALYGGLGLTKASDGGNGPRPEVTSSRFPWNGPVPPFVI